MKVIHSLSILAFMFASHAIAQGVAQDSAISESNEIEIKTLEWPDGTRYEGGVLNGKKEGQGVIYWADGSRFEGAFSNDLRNGPGAMTLPDGTVFTGIFSNNQIVVIEELEPENLRAEIEQVTREEAEREQAALELAAREEAVREEAEREQAALELAAREEAVREEAEREQAAQELAAREQAVREEAEREQAALELAAREEAAREEAEREQAAQELAAREQAVREEAEREQAALELAAREQAAREETEQAALELAVAARDSGYFTAVVYTDELEDEIVAVIDAWARAWSAQNESLYLSFYSDSFIVPGGMSRNAWERERSSRINAPDFIQVDVGYAQFELVSNGSIWVYLRQGYTSDSYSDFTNKKVQLDKEDGLWKIILEESL
ncbi:MAG: hypothetical protein COA71_10130 [SAR86 cluster bacterium]|uniref:Cds6 C-terminal domain-containing protein n=1 Tax=SAR86 cluster bacterium TaxID=2030880 RepID=A0A2A5C9M6_9GAMM|nr:MAG: hypothetical protein COA71_10130 [SAR86 cluster bacterium]